MENNYIYNKNFDNRDFSSGIEKGEYETCIFHNCNFADSDMQEINFTECTFINCDLGNARLNGAAFVDTRFENCKMIGLNFDTCSDLLLSVSFSGCRLDLTSFYKLSLKNTEFAECNLKETDFTETDLSGALFDNCNMERTVFAGTDLSKADLRTSFNFSIDPETNRIKKAKFSRDGLAGLLDKYDIIID